VSAGKDLEDVYEEPDEITINIDGTKASISSQIKISELDLGIATEASKQSTKEESTEIIQEENSESSSSGQMSKTRLTLTQAASAA